MKKAKRIIFWTLGSLLGLVLVILIVLTAILYSQKEEIKSALLDKANEYLVSHLEVKDISVSFISHFPNISIVLRDVKLDKTIPSDSAVVLLQKIECVFYVPELIRGHVSVRQLYLSEGYIDLHKDSLGVKDFAVIAAKKKPTNTPKKKTNLHIDIHRIEFKNVSFRLNDDYRPKDIQIDLRRVKAELHIDSTGAKGTLNGAVFSHQLTFKDKTFLQSMQTQCDLNIQYNTEDHTLHIDSSTVTVNNQDLRVSLLADFQNDRMLKLKIRGENALPAAVVSLLPAKFKAPIDSFEFKGEISFQVEINGSLFPGRKPFIHAEFSSHNLGLNRLGKTNRLHDMIIRGELSVRPINDTLVPSVVFHSLKGKVNGQDFTAKALIRNFNKPWLDVSIKSPIQLEHMSEIFQIKKIESSHGLALFDLHYIGPYSYLQGDTSVIPDISGHIELDSAYIKLQKIDFPFTNLTGKIIFQNEKAYITHFYVKSGHSNLTLNATFENLLPAFLSTRSTFRLDGEFHSDNLTIDDFLDKDAPVLSHKQKQKATAENKKQVKKIFEVYFPTQTYVHLKGKIGTFKNERLIIKNAELEFNMDNHIVEFKSRGNTLSGSIDSRVTMDGTNLNAIKMKIEMRLKNIDVSQFLYSFKNFHQSLVTSDVLKGKITARINTSFNVNKNLAVSKQSIRGKINFEIKDGQLINFAPFTKATNFLTKGRDLDSVSFQDINSTLTIDNSRVLLSRTAISTSAGFLYVEGSADFDNFINFLVTIPVKTIVKKYQPKPEELNNDSQAGLSVILRIEGPKDQIKVKVEKALTKSK